MSISPPVLVSGLFVFANIVIMTVVWILNLHESRSEKSKAQKKQAGAKPALEVVALEGWRRPSLKTSEILEWEFEYARVTASEAMRDRHLMVNFYLVLIGISASVLLGFYSKGAGELARVPTIILWAVCGIGWCYFLILIRLRQAWHDSARAMNKIKDYYVRRSAASEKLQDAFLWKSHTLPRPEKRWTVFFLSAMLIAFVNSASFFAGALMITFPVGVEVDSDLHHLQGAEFEAETIEISIMGPLGARVSGSQSTASSERGDASLKFPLDEPLVQLIALAVVLFAAHIVLYHYFLEDKKS